MLNLKSFEQQWTRVYPHAAAVGYLLREAYPARWMRIHSLPGGKRYPTTDLERVEVLRRHNDVATSLLGEGAECVAVVPWDCGAGGLGRVARAAGLGSVEFVSLAPVPPDHASNEPICLFATTVVWKAGTHDSALMRVAEDEIGILFFSSDSGRVYAPYDGGADLFFPTEEERDLARARYRDWLSGRPDGL